MGDSKIYLKKVKILMVSIYPRLVVLIILSESILLKIYFEDMVYPIFGVLMVNLENLWSCHTDRELKCFR